MKEDSYDLLTQIEAYQNNLTGILTPEQITEYLYRRKFIEKLLVDLVKEVEKKLERSWKNKIASIFGKDKYQKIKKELEGIQVEISKPIDTEIQLIKQKSVQRGFQAEDGKTKKEILKSSVDVSVSTAPKIGAKCESSIEKGVENRTKDFNFQDYGSIFVSVFRPIEVMRNLFSILNEIGIKKLYIFADDYSELTHDYQGLLSNTILNQYHQMSEFKVYISIAGYPNRCYLGSEIDRTKVYPLNIDFEELYKDKNFPEKHELGILFIKGLIKKRLVAFCPGSEATDFFNTTSASKEDDFYKVLFQASYNSPRLVGAILENCFSDFANGRKISLNSLKAASQKYFEGRVNAFIRESRYSIRESDVPFFNSVEISNQVDLLEKISDELKTIQTKVAGSSYEKIWGKVPPVSHFHVSDSRNDILKFLSNNYFINKIGELQAKTDKINATVYALHLGLCNKKNINYWEYNAKAKDYLKERYFFFDHIIDKFIETQKEIVCTSCNVKYPIASFDQIVKFHWTCQNCGKQACKVVEINHSSPLKEVIISEEIKLPQDDLQILEVLNVHQKPEDPIYPKEIAGYMDKSYQYVTKRMRNMAADKELVEYTVGEANRIIYKITDKARGTYF